MNNTLNRAFPIVAAALGNKFGVNVVIGGTDAMTNGKIIYLPAYNLDDPSYKDIAWGYLAHEAGHVRFSDFDLFVQSGTSPIRKDMLNIIEDIRIEKGMIGAYPGTKQTLQTLDEYLCREGHYCLVTPESHPAAILTQFMFLRLSTDILGFKGLANLAGQVETILEDVFPAGAVTRLFGLLADVPLLSSTRDALVLTDRILRMIDEEREKEAEKAKQPDNATAANSPEPDVSNAPQSSEAAGNESQQPKVPDPNSEDGAEEEAGDDQSGGQGEENHSEPTQENLSPADLLMAVLTAKDEDLPEAIADIARTVLTGQPRQSYDDKVIMPLGLPPGKHPDGHHLMNAVLAESGKIRAALQGLVQSEHHDYRVTKCHGRKVAGSKLARVAVGDSRIFEKTTTRRLPSTAVHLLDDFSGSMNRKSGLKSKDKRLVDIAMEASIALALALESIPGVNPAITRFPYRDTNNVVPLLKHGQKVRPNAAHFAAIPDGASTPLHSALWYAASAVLATKEVRKVIIVLTDGDPDSRTATQSIIERCIASGIELIGIGIGHDVGNLFDTAIRVDDITQLRDELFGISLQLLVA